MGIFGARGSSGMSPRDRRALQRAAVASKFLSAAVPTDSVASATTVNLNYTTGELVEITGTTTITAFAEANDVGEWRFVIFEGALILTHNATSFILPGSGNITTAAGDTAEFYHLGDGNWQCVRYTRGGVPPTPGAVKTANVRLTLESGVPVSTTDQVAKTTVYATPCGGNFMPIYNGTNWADRVFTEMSIQTKQSQTGTMTTGLFTISGLTDTSKLFVGMLITSATGVPAAATIASIASATSITMSGAALASVTESVTFKINGSPPVDVFAVDVSGSLALRFSRHWTTNTSRSDAITLLGGVYVNTSALTGSGNTTIAANQATYLGTVSGDSSTGNGTVDDSVLYRNIWNMFNRIPQPQVATDTTNTWTYSTAAYNIANSVSTNKFRFVRGLDDDLMEAFVFASCINSTATKRLVRVGIGVDSDNANSATVYDAIQCDNTAVVNLKASYRGYPGIGQHSLSWLEYGNGTDTQTWQGDSAGVRQCGIYGMALPAGGSGGGGSGSSSGSGTVTSVSVTTNNGVSGSVATATTTPAISLVLGNITPDSVASVGAVTGSNLSGTNTGDETAAGILTKLLTVDGAGSGLDADLLDGSSSAAFQPVDATLTAFAALTIAANSLTVGTGADAFSQTTFAANTFPARASTGNLEAKSITDFGLSLVDDADAATARTTLGLVIGTNVQAFDAQLTSVAALSYASNGGKFMRVNAGETDFELATIGGGGDALTSNPLSQFAATTSAQLAGVISDETGSGALVFATSPALVTPALGTPASGVLTNCTGQTWEKISTATASASASIAFTGLTSTYAAYMIVWAHVAPATDAVEFQFHTSTDNGSSYDTAAASYRWSAQANTDAAAASAEGSASDTKIRLASNMGNAANETNSGNLIIYNPTAALYGTVTWQSMGVNASGVLVTRSGSGQRLSAADVTALRFIMSSGNIASGVFTIYGMKA